MKRAQGDVISFEIFLHQHRAALAAVYAGEAVEFGLVLEIAPVLEIGKSAAARERDEGQRSENAAENSGGVVEHEQGAAAFDEYRRRKRDERGDEHGEIRTYRLLDMHRRQHYYHKKYAHHAFLRRKSRGSDERLRKNDDIDGVIEYIGILPVAQQIGAHEDIGGDEHAGADEIDRGYYRLRRREHAEHIEYGVYYHERRA
jgi:hypothetical protein